MTRLAPATALSRRDSDARPGTTTRAVRAGATRRLSPWVRRGTPPRAGRHLARRRVSPQISRVRMPRGRSMMPKRSAAPRRLGACAAAIALALAAGRPAAAQVPPHDDWRTFHTEHFRITFSPGLEALARHAAERAEMAYERLAQELADPPRGTIDVLLTDGVDFANGFATPFPSNRITVYATPPLDDLALAYTRDWVELVIVHELVHIFHLDDTGILGSILRAVFGRVPFGWPYFPALGTPQWSIEGLATYFESRLTGAGRTYGSMHEMVLRT